MDDVGTLFRSLAVDHFTPEPDDDQLYTAPSSRLPCRYYLEAARYAKMHYRHVAHSMLLQSLTSVAGAVPTPLDYRDHTLLHSPVCRM